MTKAELIEKVLAAADLILAATVASIAWLGQDA